MNNSQQQRDFRYAPFDQTYLFQHSTQHAANFHDVTSPTSQLASPPMSPPQHHHASTFILIGKILEKTCSRTFVV